jgi:DNA helicase-2/ATP-dependent DNA helicase PcrA
MTGMEERLFPHVRALEDRDQMEEERRLCYVGMTRARERLFLTNARRRRIFGQDQYNQPSRFIADVPRDFLDLEEEFQPALGFGQRERSREQERHYSGVRRQESEVRSQKSEERLTPDSVSGEKPARHNLAAVFEMEYEQELGNEVRVVPDEAEGVAIGMRVRHAKFGTGTIRKIEGNGDAQKVIVWFNTVGPKKLLVRFAGLERV